MKGTNRSVAIRFAVVVAAAVLAGLSCNSPRPEHVIEAVESSPALGARYTHALYDFSICPPADWDALDIVGQVDIAAGGMEKRAVAYGLLDDWEEPIAIIDVSVEPLSLAMNEEQLKRFTERSAQEGGLAGVWTRVIKVGKSLAFQGGGDYEEGDEIWTTMQVVLSGKDHTYYIRCHALKEKYPGLEKTFEECVGSFRIFD